MDIIREILAALEKPGKSRSELARRLGKHPNSITNMLKGKRRVRLNELPIIREYLELDNTSPVVGYVPDDSSDAVVLVPPDDIDTIVSPTNTATAMAALQIMGDTLGAGLSGSYVYYDPFDKEATPHKMGALCIVELPDGKMFLKVPQTAPRRRFHLLSNGRGRTITEAEVTSMSPVLYVTRRNDLERP